MVPQHLATEQLSKLLEARPIRTVDLGIVGGPMSVLCTWDNTVPQLPSSGGLRPTDISRGTQESFGCSSQLIQHIDRIE
jgi:hypothetical protein